MFQSRWGYHPCDYATYRKLKLLHLVYLEAVRLAHAWQRWKRKDPHNRVVRRRIRDDQGNTVGYESPVSMPEPVLCTVFSQKVQERRHVDKKGSYSKEGFLDEKVGTDDRGIVGDYASSRRPVALATEVRRLRMTLESIDELWEQARRWLEERDVK